MGPASYGRLLRGRYHLQNPPGLWQQCLKRVTFGYSLNGENSS